VISFFVGCPPSACLMNQQKYRKCIVKSQYKSSLKSGAFGFLKPTQLK